MPTDSSGQRRTGAAARSLESVVFGVLDLETTGLSAATDRILEVGLVVQRGGVELERFSSLVDPGVEVPAVVSALTGIGDADVRGAPALRPVLLELASVLTRNRVEVLVAHNASFDRAFLEQAWRREGFAGELPPFLCTLELSQRLLRSRGYALGALAERLDLPGGARHRALADAQVAAALLGVLLERARRKRVRSLDALLAFSRRPRPVLWRLGRRLTRPWRRWRQRRRDVGRGAVDDGTVIR